MHWFLGFSTFDKLEEVHYTFSLFEKLLFYAPSASIYSLRTKKLKSHFQTGLAFSDGTFSALKQCLYIYAFGFLYPRCGLKSAIFQHVSKTENKCELHINYNVRASAGYQKNLSIQEIKAFEPSPEAIFHLLHSVQVVF